MVKRTIRIRISHERLDALSTLCSTMKTEFIPTSEHDRLLHEYMQELHHRLRSMLDRKQDTYTLMLNGTESMAFYQLWKKLDLRNDAYAQIIVDSLIRKMSAIA